MRIRPCACRGTTPYDVRAGTLLDAEGSATTDISMVRGYRLPTEAEWEYAAREGGRDVRFGNGTDVADPAEAAFDAAAGDYPYLHRGSLRRGTAPVRTFAPNALHLYDMAGNAWEWVSDFLTPYPPDAWGGDASELRTAKRFQWQSNNRCNASGFRLARSQ
jgi:formylglycine-generating enzyme required for sulfatase activity